MSEMIAKICLERGNVGFYDPLSRIHLSLGKETTVVFAGTNCAGLRRAVRNGTIRVIEGSLGEDVPQFKLVRVDGKLRLAPNTAAEMKPVVKTMKEKADTAAEKIKEIQDKAEAEIKARLEKEKDAAEPETAEESKTEEPAAEAVTDVVAETVEEKAEGNQREEEPQAEEAPVKKGGRKKKAKA